MSELVNFYTSSLPRRPETRTRLLEEIAFLESRLLAMDSGDCAYEKTMARGYTALLSVRRNELAALPGA